MKIYCATMIHESNSFSAIPTSLDNFRESALYMPSTGEGKEHLGQVMADVDPVALTRKFDCDVVVGLIANAEPSLPLRADSYRQLKEEILDNLRKALPVDGVFLFLHGAQMADGVPDCESDLVLQVRSIVGRGVPIAVELDLHCNIGDSLLQNADIVLACLEYPHIDFAERAELAMSLLIETANKEIEPVNIIERIPAFGLYPTTTETMAAFIADIKSMENRQGIHAISMCQGFTGGDNADTCASVLVVAEKEATAAGRQIAREIADRFWQIKDVISQQRTPAEAAISEALTRMNSDARGPLVFADTSDNPGGGAAGDSTYFLAQFLDRKISGMALGMIWDPLAAQLAAKAGEGAKLALRLGGKSGPASCNPLDVDVTVTAVNENAAQTVQGARALLGLTVALDIAGNSVVVNSIRQQTFSPQCFTEVGIDPLEKRLLIVKSGQHFHETFSPFASHIIYADGPTGVPVDYMTYPYENIKHPVWPFDPLPFEAYGCSWK